jgi:hypothetical protein
VKKFIENITRIMPIFRGLIDLQVYKNNGSLRMYKCSKFKSNIALKPLEVNYLAYHKDEFEYFTKSLICYTFDCDSSNYLKCEPQIEKTRPIFSTTKPNIKKSLINNPINRYIVLPITSKLSDLKNLFGATNGFRQIEYDTWNKILQFHVNLGATCPIAQRIHQHNHWYVTLILYSDPGYYCNCYDQECENKRTDKTIIDGNLLADIHTIVNCFI